jgi:hypothetical protein
MEKRPLRFHCRPKDPGNDDGVDASAVSTLTYFTIRAAAAATTVATVATTQYKH